MDIILTQHAEEQMVRRGIEKYQIIKALKRGSKIRQTDGWLSIYQFIGVAYKITKSNKYKVKTVMII